MRQTVTFTFPEDVDVGEDTRSRRRRRSATSTLVDRIGKTSPSASRCARGDAVAVKDVPEHLTKLERDLERARLPPRPGRHPRDSARSQAASREPRRRSGYWAWSSRPWSPAPLLDAWSRAAARRSSRDSPSPGEAPASALAIAGDDDLVAQLALTLRLRRPRLLPAGTAARPVLALYWFGCVLLPFFFCTDDLYLLFNASSSGVNGRGSRGHNEALSVSKSQRAGRPSLWIPGRTFTRLI